METHGEGVEMPPSLLPIRIRPTEIRRTVVRVYRGHSERSRARREHDFVMGSDHRFAVEHRAQVNRAVELGHGGCPYCERF